MRNRFLILSLVAATLFACSSDSMINDDFNETAQKRKGVPFKVKKLEGTYTLGGNATCATLTAIGEGTVSHLGKSALLEEWCWDGNQKPEPEPEEIGERSVTFTAANGDMLHGKIMSIRWEGLTFTEEVDITGGTGRFANADGTFTETVVISDPTPGFGTFTYSAEGTITY